MIILVLVILISLLVLDGCGISLSKQYNVFFITLGINFFKKHGILCANGTGSQVFDCMVIVHDIVTFYLIFTFIIISGYVVYQFFTIRKIIHVIGFLNLIIHLCFTILVFLRKIEFADMLHLFSHLKQLNSSLFRETSAFFNKPYPSSLDDSNIIKFLFILNWLYKSENSLDKKYQKLKRYLDTKMLYIIVKNLVIILFFLSFFIPCLTGLYMLDPNHAASFTPISDVGMTPITNFSNLSLPDQKLFVDVFKNQGVISQNSAATLHSYIDSGISVQDELNYSYMYHLSSNRHFISNFDVTQPRLPHIFGPEWRAAFDLAHITQNKLRAAEALGDVVSHPASSVKAIMTETIPYATEIMQQLTVVSDKYLKLVQIMLGETPQSYNDLQTKFKYISFEVTGQFSQVSNLLADKIIDNIFPVLKLSIQQSEYPNIVLVISPVVANHLSASDAMLVSYELANQLQLCVVRVDVDLVPINFCAVAPSVVQIENVSVVSGEDVNSIANLLVHTVNKEISTNIGSQFVTIYPVVGNAEYSEILPAISSELCVQLKPIIHGMLASGRRPLISCIVAPVTVIPL